MSSKLILRNEQHRWIDALQEWLPSERACLEHLAGLHWPKGFHCRICKGTTLKERVGENYICGSPRCEIATSVRHETIFHRTTTELMNLYRAAWLLVCDKREGVTVEDILAVTGWNNPSTAREWLDVFMAAMTLADRQPLNGLIEMDLLDVSDEFNLVLKARSEDALYLLVAIETRNDKNRRIRVRKLQDALNVDILAATGSMIVQDSNIEHPWPGFRDDFIDAGFQSTDALWGRGGEDQTPNVEIFRRELLRLCQSSTYNAYRKIVPEFAITECVFRFNRRTLTNRHKSLFNALIAACIGTEAAETATIIRSERRQRQLEYRRVKHANDPVKKKVIRFEKKTADRINALT